MATILVVDDNAINRRVLSLTLSSNGFTVVTAVDGQNALDLLENQSVDLAIVDISMPIMDGITLLRELRQSDQYMNLPVIMLTSSSMDEDRVSANEAGANDFLTKPTSSWDLLETVRRYIA